MDIYEPAIKRAVAFFDGQNLYRHAKDAFGHHHPNFDPIKLFDAVCAELSFENQGIRFYTGYVTFQLPEVAVPRDLSGKIPRMIDDPRSRPAPS